MLSYRSASNARQSHHRSHRRSFSVAPIISNQKTISWIISRKKTWVLHYQTLSNCDDPLLAANLSTDLDGMNESVD